MAPAEPISAKVRVGIVGAGWWASLAHIPGVLEHPHAELVGIADRDAKRLADVAEHFGIDESGLFADHRELLAAGIDALVVATPHTTHHALAGEALDTGIHVLVEKPMTLHASEARDLDARAKAAGVHLCVGHTFHFSSSAQEARALISRGELGEVTLVSALYASQVAAFLRGDATDRSVLSGPDPATYSDPVLAGGGQGQTQGTHALELVLWTTGLRAERVSAFMSNLDAAVDMIDAISYRFEGGALGTLASAGTLTATQAEQTELRYYGTRGLMTHDLNTSEVAFHPAEGESRTFKDAGDSYPYMGAVRCLIDVIRGESENLIPAASAIASVELLEAAYRSAAEGGRPVDVAELG